MASQEEIAAKAADVLQGIARQINCLSDDNRTTRRRGIDGIRKATLGKEPPLEKEILKEVLNHIVKSILKCFSDPVEKCRELAIHFIGDYITSVDNFEDILPYLIPTLVQRLGCKEIVENAEELRLTLVELLTKIVEICKKNVAPYLDDMIQILQKTIVDPYPEVKKQSCKCTSLLAKTIPEHFHLLSESLIAPLLLTVSHQHSKVRVACINTIGDVLQYGSPKPMENVIPHLTQRFFDQAPTVRVAVTDVVGHWLLDFIDRYSFHSKLIPLLLGSVSDELPEIQNQAKQLWKDVGAKYQDENEEELKKQIDFGGPDPALPPGEDERPGLGCRILVYRNLIKILPGIVNDLSDWTVSNRVMSSKLLCVLLLNAEDHVTQHLAALLTGLYKACGDDEQQVVERVIKSAELTGWFVKPEIYCNLVLPTLKSSQNANVLTIFAALIRGTPPGVLQSRLHEICDTLAEPDVCRAAEMKYLYQVLACTDAVISKCGEDCKEYSLQLFTVLLTVLAMTNNIDLMDEVKVTLKKLSEVQGLGDSYELYHQHTKQVLDSLKGSYEQWTNYSTERLIFDTLLTEAGPVVGEHLDEVIPMLKTNLRPEKDPELRLKLFSLLSRLVTNASYTLNSQERFGDFVIVVVKDMIIPNCVWHAGRTSAAVRTITVSCLWALFQSELLTDVKLNPILDDLVTQLVSLLEDDVRTTRLVTCRVLQKLLTLCKHSFDPERLHKMYMELLKRMDDSNDEVRVATARTFSAYFNCFQSDYDASFYRAHLEEMYKGLLVHLDDPDPIIQDAVFDVLKQAASICPAMLQRQIDDVKHKHRIPKYCNHLSEHINTLQSSS
ncbi:dynein axonemal assembly factor 5-like [Saccoglossus kowalevskii]|uniref:HEAT repeat-containing protein 2-like n=1 Tax=Saccoglossus kowalevskii TaxID=10224 RepID=A0ABM0GYR4_SACKO|nr:PREDICTED: HEAT repeat-containing protein 2-like [Saccoglossus kowalevskii]